MTPKRSNFSGIAAPGADSDVYDWGLTVFGVNSEETVSWATSAGIWA